MNIALITEGASEHRIIKHVLGRYFKEIDPDIVQIQPIMNNGKQLSTGGWAEVLKYCGLTKIRDILVENDYLVIQIDTDQSQQSPFDVSHTKDDNTEKSALDLYEDVVDKLNGIVLPDIWSEYRNRIMFAICVHSIECWLLPLYVDVNNKSKTRDCPSKLNHALRKHNIQAIPASDKNSIQSARTYDSIMKQKWRKVSEIEESASYNAAFQAFLKQLSSIDI